MSAPRHAIGTPPASPRAPTLVDSLAAWTRQRSSMPGGADLLEVLMRSGRVLRVVVCGLLLAACATQRVWTKPDFNEQA